MKNIGQPHVPLGLQIGLKDKYLFNGKELQEDFGLYQYDFGARTYDPQLARWFSVDPLAGKFSAWSPYNYTMNNPINLIDPDGRAPMPPDEFNVDRNTGKITKISNKGGSTTDFFNEGATNSEGKFVSSQTLEVPRGGGTINSFRFRETSKETVSSFVIPGTEIKGFFIEPAGPSTTVANQNKRVPEGSFNVTKNVGSDFPNDFRLFNKDVPQDRAILIHSGNSFTNTRGCLVCGSELKGNTIPFGKTRPIRDEIRSFIKTKDPEKVKVNIFNVIPNEEQK